MFYGFILIQKNCIRYALDIVRGLMKTIVLNFDKNFQRQGIAIKKK